MSQLKTVRLAEISPSMLDVQPLGLQPIEACLHDGGQLAFTLSTYSSITLI